MKQKTENRKQKTENRKQKTENIADISLKYYKIGYVKFQYCKINSPKNIF